MNTTHSIAISATGSKIAAYIELLKVRLSALVAFSCAFGYVLSARGNIHWFSFIMLLLGGFLLSGASVALNQIIEREFDKVMTRTMWRPLPTGRLTVLEASLFAGACLLISIFMLWTYTNMLTTLLSLLSFFLYTLVYTPLKRVGSIAVFVGAIPGALPPLIGWTACTGMLSYEAWIIFSLQFIWQFPHFWSIAWLAHDDYQRAGFKLLPSSSGKGMNSRLQIMLYTFFLLPLGILPWASGITGEVSALLVSICGFVFLTLTFSLMRNASDQTAKHIMFASFIYLPLMQVAFLCDKM